MASGLTHITFGFALTFKTYTSSLNHVFAGKRRRRFTSVVCAEVCVPDQAHTLACNFQILCSFTTSCYSRSWILQAGSWIRTLVRARGIKNAQRRTFKMFCVRGLKGVTRATHSHITNAGDARRFRLAKFRQYLNLYQIFSTKYFICCEIKHLIDLKYF